MTQMSGRRRMSGGLARRAHEFAAAGKEPVKAKLASSVVVIRDVPEAADGVEVYIHRRHRGMRFAAGVVAFPGGGVDPIDIAVPIEHEETWARRLRIADPMVARAHLGAAVRELAEETGVIVGPSELTPWAHGITPTFERRRYDTWFFLLPLPDGVEPRDVSGETEGVGWVRPADELDRAESGESILMPPTRAVLNDIADLGSVAEAVGAGQTRTISTVQPSWELDGDDVVLIIDEGR